EKSNQTKGSTLEVVGHYHPRREKLSEQIALDMPRVEHWISKGALPSETVANIIRKTSSGTEK
ncbi:MAG: 30S ribosomal protein S16, partial [Elusimicrobiaceae bacterium]